MNSITIELPFPISANRYWRTGKNGVNYVSPEAEVYKYQIGLLCNVAGCEPMSGMVGIIGDLYMPSTNRDMGNTQKVLEDSLQEHLYYDDNQITQQFYFRYEAKSPKKENAKVIITVGQIESVGDFHLITEHINSKLVRK